MAFLHVSDLHLNPSGFDLVRQVVDQFHVDAVLDTGDITDWGSQPENGLITSVGSLGVPYVYIRGNHDSATTAALVAAQRNATVLERLRRHRRRHRDGRGARSPVHSRQGRHRRRRSR